MDTAIGVDDRTSDRVIDGCRETETGDEGVVGRVWSSGRLVVVLFLVLQ